MNKFEQLIEFVINDEEDKARELFHEIVVEKSRDIYEDIMAEEETVEEDVVEEDEAVEEAVESDEDAETVEEGIDEIDELGGSQAGDLIDEIETEEEGINMEAEDDEDDDAEDLEDRVVSVENQLDALMAEFEELMGDVDQDGDGDHDMDDHEAEDEMDMDNGEEEVMDIDMETEGLEEAVSLTAAPKPVTSEQGDGKSGPVAANSGAKGMEAKPVSTDSSDEKGRPAPKAQDMGSTTEPHEAAAPKATTAEPAGINDKSPMGS